MRQLLIVAIEGDEPVSVDQMAIDVPCYGGKAMAYAEIITADEFLPKDVSAVAKRCTESVSEGPNIRMGTDMSEREAVSLGLKTLDAWLQRDAMGRKYRRASA